MIFIFFSVPIPIFFFLSRYTGSNVPRVKPLQGTSSFIEVRNKRNKKYRQKKKREKEIAIIALRTFILLELKEHKSNNNILSFISIDQTQKERRKKNTNQK